MNNKHIIKVLCTVVVLVGMTFTAQAQIERTGYFLKGNSYGHRLNPSFQPRRNYLAVPVVGNTSFGIATNIEITDFVYPSGDGLITFLHPDIDAKDFVGNLSKNNKLNMSMDMTPFSLGFYAFGGFNTIDLGIHADAGFNIPRDFFGMFKDMGAEKYVLDNFGFRARSYADIAIGHSHKVNGNLTVGARLKLLVGLAYAEVAMDKMELAVSDKQWQINAKGSAVANVIGSKFTYDKNGIISGIGSFVPELSNLGFGVDLGATYDFSKVLTKGLILSASLNDINFIKWNNAAQTGISPSKPYTFEGFSEVSFDGGENSINQQLTTMGEELTEFFAVDEMNPEDYSDFWGATLNIGVEYKMPFYNKLSVGALFTQRFESAYSYTIGSLMVNFSPFNFFDLAASASVSTYGFNYGAMLNINLPGFSIFAGTEIYTGKYGLFNLSKEGLRTDEVNLYYPLSKFNTSAMIGINIPFGKKH